MHNSLLMGVIYLCLGLSTTAQTIRMKDQSDWWSLLNERAQSPEVRSSVLDLDPTNFEIANLHLGNVGLNDIQAKLGRTTIIERGDASTNRQQTCYRSAGDRQLVYLIFEFGEDQSTFYLFADGAPWKGKAVCTTSTQVSTALSTASGVKLGLRAEAVKAILGQPDAISADRLIYSRQIRRKSTPARFDRQRKEYPDRLSDAEAHKKFDFYTVSLYLEARFTASKLSYLAVSQSGE